MREDKMAKSRVPKRVNAILYEGMGKCAENASHYITVQCHECGSNFYLDNVGKEIQISQGIISDAHGVVEGYQFRFPCPSCGTFLRFDEDEVELRVRAVPDKQHS